MRLLAVCFLILALAGAVGATGSGSIQSGDSPAPSTNSALAQFALSSPDFGTGAQQISSRYTCDGMALSPPLRWSHAPEGTRSYALICDDPDAVEVMGYVFVHWVLFNIPSRVDSLGEGVLPEPELPDGSRHGTNSLSRRGYAGPCPPHGEHRYFFRLYALDTSLDLAAGASAERLRQAMEGHVLARTELMGLYTRP